MDFAFLSQFAVSLFLHMVRVGAFFAVVPLFGRQGDSMILRLVLSTAIGAIFWWVGDQTVPQPSSLLVLGVMIIREAIIGFALGFAIAAIVSFVATAGEIISSEMGFSMARAINPETGGDATVISQLLQVLITLLIFQQNLHHEALRILEQTFHACPIGDTFAIEPIWDGLQALVGGAIAFGTQYSMPIIGMMLLLSTGTVLIGRAVPSINMMEFAFGMRVLLAMAVLGFYLVEGMPFLLSVLEGMFARTAEMFGG